MPATATDELIDALEDVADLDALHALVSNEHLDQYAPLQFTRWLLELVNTERRRRESGEAVTEYPMHAFSLWLPRPLYAATTVALTIAEAAVIEGEPTRLQFALRLQQLLVGSMGLALLEATER